ncbi:MAG: hypothetical protein ACXABM_16775 [Candidatus Thorarchaeota archaeon]|jgi:hypothetical protein
MEQDHKIESDFDRNTKGAILILLVGCSLLVFVVGGYNNFWSTDMRLLGRISSVLILFVETGTFSFLAFR